MTDHERKLLQDAAGILSLRQSRASDSASERLAKLAEGAVLAVIEEEDERVAQEAHGSDVPW